MAHYLRNSQPFHSMFQLVSFLLVCHWLVRNLNFRFEIKGSFEPTHEYDIFEPSHLLDIFASLPPPPPPPLASNSPLPPPSNAIPMVKAGDYYMLQAQCSLTPSPRHFAPPTPHPLQLTPHSPLPPTPSPWLRQVTISYCGLNVNSNRVKQVI